MTSDSHNSESEKKLVWVCPVHRDRLPKFNGGRLWCLKCSRGLPDAVQVPWPPEGDE